MDDFQSIPEFIIDRYTQFHQNRYNRKEIKELIMLDKYFSNPSLYKMIEPVYTKNNKNYKKAKIELQIMDAYVFNWMFENCPKCNGYLLQNKIGTIKCCDCDYIDETNNVIINNNIEFG